MLNRGVRGFGSSRTIGPMKTLQNFFELTLIGHVVTAHVIDCGGGNDAVETQTGDISKKEGVVLLVVW